MSQSRYKHFPAFCSVFLLFSSGYATIGKGKINRTPDITRINGYPSETHTIQTADGYLLDIHRISHAPNKTATMGVVLLMHGVLTSSACWLVSGIAFYFSDQGYDVWMGNMRGTKYSQKHVSISSNDDKFWEFSMDEIALYDVPTTIDYILHTTKKHSLTYIGHSMGATVFFEMVSAKKEYNRKIDLFIGISPVAFQGRSKNPVRFLVPYADEICKLTEVHHFSSINKFNEVIASACNLQAVNEEICTIPIFFLVGYDMKQFDPGLLSAIIESATDSTSGKVLHHITQRINSGKFTKYDYGTEENMRRYNSSEPPAYNLSSIEIPVVFATADNDLLVAKADFLELKASLTNTHVVRDYMVPFEGFNHLDFVFAKDVIDLVYVEILKTMKTCSNRKCARVINTTWRIFG